jgi:hypothetical protein
MRREGEGARRREREGNYLKLREIEIVKPQFLSDVTL